MNIVVCNINNNKTSNSVTAEIKLVLATEYLLRVETSSTFTKTNLLSQLLIVEILKTRHIRRTKIRGIVNLLRLLSYVNTVVNS